MTVTELITNLSNTSLVGQDIADLTKAENVTTLITLVNMAKDKIAEDTLLWLDGETITMTTGVYEYTLSTIPVQIIDVYDQNSILRPRNNPDTMGYYQTTPNTLKFNTISNGTDVNVNYYKTPADYIGSDTIVMPATLLSSIQYYVAHKAFELYKAESDIFTSKEYYAKYMGSIRDYMKNSDSTSSDTIVSRDNKIYKRGLI